MGKFKFSKRAYIDKVKERRDWDGTKEEKKERPDINKTTRCRKYVSQDGDQSGSITVTIKSGVCDSAYMCSAICNFR